MPTRAQNFARWKTIARWTTITSFAVAVGLTALAPHTVTAETLAPSIIGSVFDSSPFDGVADGVGDIPFISAATFTHHRAVFEFDLSGVPAGTVQAASLTGLVASNNGFDTGTRIHNVDVFSGDGNVTLADYDAPGAAAGSFSHPSGGSTAFDLNVAALLQTLLDGGATHFGVRISAGADPQFPDVIVDEPETPLQLTFTIAPATLIGDYDGSGSVGTEDYTLWKDTFGATSGELRADGNLNVAIDAGDFTIWRDHLPSGGGALGIAVPEPASPAMFTLALAALLAIKSRAGGPAPAPAKRST